MVLAAEYDQNQHQVTINGGSGSGSYLVGETVTLVADEAGTGKEFTGWEVEEGAVSIQNANKQKASFEMPDGELSSMRFSRISIIRFPSMTGMVPEPTITGIRCR